LRRKQAVYPRSGQEPNRLSFCEAWFVKWLQEWGEREGEVKHIVSVLSSTALPMFCRRCTEMPWIKRMTFLEGVSGSNRW
jgi:hypothetical protein